MRTLNVSGNIRVDLFTESDHEDWYGYLADHPQATVYHTLAWRDVLVGGFGYQPLLLLARSISGGDVRGLVPLYRVKSPLHCHLTAVPFRDRGGLLWSDDEAFIALVEASRRIAEQMGTSSITFKSISAYPENLIEACGLNEQLYWVRSRVDLTVLTREILPKRLGAKTRNMLQQARLHGLQARMSENPLMDLDHWYHLHLSTQKRLGLPPFPRAFFRLVFEKLRVSGSMALWLVSRGDEKPLAASILLLHRKTAIYGYSASTPGGQSSRANDLMLYSILDWLIEHGYREFDMGSDAPSQEGLLFFKRKWLATQEPIPSYHFGPHTVMDSSAGKFTLARALFRHMPKPVLKLLGTLMTRYLG